MFGFTDLTLSALLLLAVRIDPTLASICSGGCVGFTGEILLFETLFALHRIDLLDPTTQQAQQTSRHATEGATMLHVRCNLELSLNFA